MAPPAKNRGPSQMIRRAMANMGRSPVNDRDGTARYRNNQNAAYLKGAASIPNYPGNGQNAAHLKNAGAGWGGRKKRPGKKPEIEDPPLPPSDDTDTPTSPPPASPPPATSGPVPTQWPEIVDYFFPNGGTGYKDGGLVRGGGAATKGRGRGKIV